MDLATKLKNYLSESYQEIKKVTWPTKQETTNYTLLVVGISLGVALFLGIVDYILASGLEKYLIG
jgi:preprotein translocase subunit SecE